MLVVAAAVVLPLVLRSAPPDEMASDVQASPDQRDPSPDRIRITSFGGGDEPLPVIGGAVKEPEAPAGRIEPPARDADADDAPAVSGWAVQIGSFADPENARRLKNQVEERGYRVVTERVTTSEGKPRVRVLVSPDRTRSIPAATLRLLRNKESIDGFLVRYPG